MRSWLAVVALVGACGDESRGVCHAPAQLTTYAYVGPGHSQFTPVTALPAMVAGGTWTVPLYCDTGAGECEGSTCFLADFDLPYDVEVRSGPVVFDGRDPDGAWVFRADGAGTGSLAFVDPDGGPVYAEIATRAVELDHVVASSPPGEAEPPGLEIVMSSQQDPPFSVSLLSATDEYLVDTSLAIQLPVGAEQTSPTGFSVRGLATGMYTVGVQSAGKTFREPLEITNEADSIELAAAPTTIPQKPLVPGMLEYVCFVAKNQGRAVAGLRWQHLIDGMPPEDIYSERCVLALTDKPSGSMVTFTATAGGKTLTVQIPAR